MEDKEKQQELMFKFQMFEQQIQNINQQLQAVEKAILDMTSLKIGLDELKGKTDSEIYAPIGKGIFAKAKLISEDLNVDIGGGNIVKKTIPETQEIIQEQINRLEEAKKELNKAMEDINNQLTQTMQKYQE